MLGILGIGFVLLANFDRVTNAHFFKRLIPIEDAFLDPIAVTPGRGVFDVKDDRILGWAQLE